MNIKNKIVKICGKTPNEEVCGFIVFENGELEIIQVKNRAKIKEQEFYIPAKEFLSIKKTKEIVAVYHSHPSGETEPSKFDEQNSELICYPFLIYSTKKRKFNIYKPQFIDCDLEHLKKLEEALND
jgi:proteasome lid subunit RPN8/RPN11